MIEDLERPHKIIRNALSSMEFSRHVTHEQNTDMREKWVQAEIFQILRLGFMSTGQVHYGVRLESGHAHGRTDIHIIKEGWDQHCIIEVKRAAEQKTLEELPRQLRNAQDALPLTRSFAFIFVEDERTYPKTTNHYGRS